MNSLINFLKTIINKIKLSKINFLNSKFKKFIIKYEEQGNKIKIYNSNGDYKLVENNIPNKVKIMEIIKDHKIEIEKRISYYNDKKDDYKIIILTSGLILIILGFLFVFSFFFGIYALLIVSLLSFSVALYLFSLNTYKILIFREEIKRLNSIKNNKLELDSDELKELIIDMSTLIKSRIYSLILKIYKKTENKSKI